MDRDQDRQAEQASSRNTEINISRRRFIGTATGAAALGLTASLPIEATPVPANTASADENGFDPVHERLREALELRVQIATDDAKLGMPEHINNGDEHGLPNHIGSFGKALRHDPVSGEVDVQAYSAFLEAVSIGTFAAYESLAENGMLGCPDPARQRRLVNPMSGYAFELGSMDSHQFAQPPAPAFSSAEEAGEMVELYWMALLRDVDFLNYASSSRARAAADDLSQLSDFRGPKEGGTVTTQTLFRDDFPGCTIGPYISQFLFMQADYGAQRVDQRIRVARAGTDFATNFNDWLDLQLGCQPTRQLDVGGVRFCRKGRDLGQYVHIDALYQAYQVASLVLLSQGLRWDQNNPYGQSPEPGSGTPLAPGVQGARAQVGFGTFGGPDILATVCEVSTRALRAVWFQKWQVHRRLRPEEFGGRVEVIRLGRRSLQDYPIHPDLFASAVLPRVLEEFNSHLLPLSFPEGSPVHPAYGAGHATVAGACVTVLKAFFDEDQIIQNPVVPHTNGKNLEPFAGPPLTVGGELNKLASNISQGRNIAGVHWRTDGVESILLGERVAISMLANMRKMMREPFEGFRLTKFDGTPIVIR